MICFESKYMFTMLCGMFYVHTYVYNTIWYALSPNMYLQIYILRYKLIHLYPTLNDIVCAQIYVCNTRVIWYGMRPSIYIVICISIHVYRLVSSHKCMLCYSMSSHMNMQHYIMSSNAAQLNLHHTIK